MHSIQCDLWFYFTVYSHSVEVTVAILSQVTVEMSCKMCTVIMTKLNNPRLVCALVPPIDSTKTSGIKIIVHTNKKNEYTVYMATIKNQCILWRWSLCMKLSLSVNLVIVVVVV